MRKFIIAIVLAAAVIAPALALAQAQAQAQDVRSAQLGKELCAIEGAVAGNIMSQRQSGVDRLMMENLILEKAAANPSWGERPLEMMREAYLMPIYAPESRKIAVETFASVFERRCLYRLSREG